MSNPSGKVSPIVVIAAVSIIVFSAVGVAVMTGLIPSSFSRSEPLAAAPAAEKTSSPATASVPTPPAPAAAQAPAASPAPAAAAEPKRTAEPSRPATRTPSRTAAARVCADCGTVSAVNVIEKGGEGTGLGAVAGGVVGGVLGNQIGDGRGRRVATVAGAAGGAYAGHQIEKHVKKTRHWDVVVRMDDGSTRVFAFEHEPAFRPGDKVKVVDGRMIVAG